MHVLGVGPFDNDIAEAFATELDDADPDERLVMLRRALQAALDAEEGLDMERAFRAYAAAAVVAAACPGGPQIETDYAPEFLTLDDTPKLHPDHPMLARDALERLDEPDSAWYKVFEKAGTLHDAVETLEYVRDSVC
jgi:hypothetical protein